MKLVTCLDLGAQHARYRSALKKAMGALATYNTRRCGRFSLIHFLLPFFMFFFQFSLFLFLSFFHVVLGRMRGLLDRRDQVQPVRIPLNVNDVRQYSLNLAMVRLLSAVCLIRVFTLTTVLGL